MTRFRFAVFACLASGLVAPATAQNFPTRVDGRCRQGQCPTVEFQSRTEVERTGRGVLYRVSAREGRALGPGRVVWRAPTESYAFCSIGRPAYVFRAPGAQAWTAHLLSPGHPAGIAGYNWESHQAYNVVCHGVDDVEGPLARAVAGAQGYPANLVANVGQIELKEPRDIVELP